MKKIIILLLIVSVSLYAKGELIPVTKEELDLSKEFVKLERIQQKNLYTYVKLVKNRYILTKEEVWVSRKITDAISLESSMILLRKNDEN